MTVNDLIQQLQRLNPNVDVLVESDTGLPWGCRGACNDVWIEDDGTETPVVLIRADS